MKKTITLLAVVIQMTAFGQMSGVYTIPGGTPGFPSIAAAIAALNLSSVGPGGVIFDVAPGYTETTTDSLVLTATGSAGNTILFRKAGPGVNPKITRTDAGSKATTTLGGQGDAVITIQGSDFVTFDGIDVATLNMGIEYGYYLRKASVTDGCKFVFIKNATITLTKGTSAFVAGIYASNNSATSSVSSATGITITSTGGRNENVTITGNTIQNVFTGILLRGFNHTTLPNDFQDINFVIGAAGEGNIIQNYAGNTASASYGVYLIYHTSPNVSYNTISNAGGGGSNATSTLYGVFMSSSNAGGDMVFSYNNITLNQGATSLANCIHIAPKGNSAMINNNQFSYGTFNSTTGSYMIYCSNATPNITVSNNQIAGPILKTGIGPFDLYYNFGSPASGTTTISNNNFSNVTVTGASTFYAIRQYTSVNQTEIISNNTISNITGGTSPIYGIYQGYGAAGSMVNNNTVTNMNGSGTVIGIYLGANTAPVSLAVFENNVTALTTSGTTLYGIQNFLGQANTIYRNKICNLQINNAAGIIYGLLLSGGTNTYVYNNFISGITAPVTNAAINLAGIYIAGGTNAYVWYNSVYLNASSSAGLFGSAALYASTTPNLDMRNNILVNKSIPSGATGYTVAYRRSGTNLSTYATTSNANCFFGGAPSPANLIYYDGTTSFTTMPPYQAFVGPLRDNISFTEDPPFALPPCNLHMVTTVPTKCESGAVSINAPIPVTDDIDGNLRSASPDVGADEFPGIPGGVINPGSFTATTVNSQHIDLGFTTNPAGDAVLIVWNNTGVFTPPAGPPPLPGMPFCDGIVLSFGVISPVPHPGLIPATTYYYKAFSYNGADYSSGVITSASTNLQPPVSLTASAVSSSQIDLAWVKNMAANDVLVATNNTSTFGSPVNGTAYLPGSTLTGGGTVIYVGPANLFNHTGLTPLTTYYYKIWSTDIFNWYSLTGQTANATTLCAPISILPWNESFETVTIPAFPPCWYKENGDWVTTNNANTSYDADARTGTQFLREAYSATNEYMWSPGFALAAGNQYDFSFWWAGDTYSGWQAEVFYNTFPSSVGATQLGAAFVTLTDITTKTYAEVIRSLTPLTDGVYYFGIRVNCPTSTPWYLSFDDFKMVLVPPPITITGVAFDTTGAIIPSDHLYIIAYNPCNPNDSLSTLNGGITLAPGGSYTVHCNQFADPPVAGEQVIMSFFDIYTEVHSPETVTLAPTPVTVFNPVLYQYRHVHLPYKTSYVRVVIPPHKTLQIHYTFVHGCGNTDVFEWTGNRWTKFRQWNWNHYCTWKYINNPTSSPKVYVIHNDNGNIWFDLTFNCPYVGPTSPSNYNEFALLNMGWRDRPQPSCEFGNIVSPNHLFIDYEGAALDQFPSVLGQSGAQNLTIQFQSYSNIFWNDMQLMVELANVTQPGTLELNIPDAIIPISTAQVSPGDTAVFFNTGGITSAGAHLLELHALSGLNVSLDGLIYTSLVPVPDLPTVVTLPVTGITSTSAISGGNVTNDGGAPVTVRGVCWSTLPSPTILDNYTTDGAGLGIYTSNLMGLTPLTTYYARAYATNMTGTAYGQEFIFQTLPVEILITGVAFDTTGAVVPPGNLYIIAYNPCNPNDSLSTLSGGITFDPNGGYTVHCNQFADPPMAGDQVIMSFFDVFTEIYTPETVTIAPTPVTIFNPVLYVNRHVHLPYKTSYVRVVIPPHKTLQIHYTFVHGCGNTDVFEWTGNRWTKFRQWNWNHYCTWKYINNSSSSPKIYVIHNDNGNIKFDLTFNCPYIGPTSPSNYNEFALFNMGWRDRPQPSCEFGNIVAPAYTFFDFEGAALDQFPSVLGLGGVQNLAIQFESHSNMFWNDMQLMVELENVTQPGTLELHIPDAMIPVTTVPVNPGDTALFFNTGGILIPGPHTMTFTASPGLSARLDGMIYTSLVPIPNLPTVVTSPVTGVTSSSAISGGNVTSDGGAAVTARGVCWSTTPAPTILNSHTTDGSGLGIFTSNLSGLTPLTTYYFRAYATNFTGTAYGQELVFQTLPMEMLITGTAYDSTGLIVPSENLYVIAYNPCNPNDTLSTLNGGITLAPGGNYTVHCNQFADPPTAGDQVIMSFFDIFTEIYTPETVTLAPTPVTVFNPVLYVNRHVHLPYKTSYVRVVIPPHKTLQIHYTFVHGCGNTDVFEWTGNRWTKFRQWNWNHYCTWKYINNASSSPKVYVIHNDNGNIWFDLTFNCPYIGPTSPSNYNEFALFNMGWRDRPQLSCEFGNIVAPAYTFFDFEGAALDQFPSVLGLGGVQNLAIQFESYSNMFWNDMQLMVELENVTQPGTLELHIPDATIPLVTVPVNPGDTALFFNTGGILMPGPHTMTLSASPGLSARLDGMIYTSLVPVPDPPTVTTNPVTSILANSATSGGVVTSDGGAPVTARGVCWSTTPAPTILGSHTTDGTGLGPFTSVMTGLIPATTYYVRAYATNLSGTGYGQEYSFTTLHEVLFVSGVAESGEFNCFDATQVITVGGLPDTYVAYPSSTTILIAGQKIKLLPGTWFKHSSYMHGYIAPLGPWCDQFTLPAVPLANTIVEPLPVVDRNSFVIYPNPTNSDITIVQKGPQKLASLKIEIRDMHGSMVLKQTISGADSRVIHLADIIPGMYIVKVMADGYVETIKLIKVN